MNDPGTAEPISQAAGDMEKQLHKEDSALDDDVYNFLDPRL